MQELSQKTLEELRHLRKCVDYEIYKRSDEVMAIKREKIIFINELQKYGYYLIKFIEDNLEYSIVTDSRKSIFTNARFILMNHLRKKGMALNSIGNLFYRDHATVITGIRKCNDLFETKEPFFMEQYDKITNLIEKYNELQS